MSTYAGLARDWGEYTSDDGNAYNVGLSMDNLSQGGFPAATPGSNPAYPRGFVMRHVYGVASDGTRARVPIASAGDALFIAGTSFTKGGKSFDVEGRIGEKRSYKGG